jgi:hypothetical protein
MIFKKAIPVVFFVLAGIAFSSCTSDKFETGPCISSIPDTVLFSQHVQPLLDTYCSTPGCHSGTIPAGNLNLENAQAYTELLQPGKGYVDTSNPKFSILHIQMNSTTQPMPPTGRLDACTVNLVLKWIEQGAKNN